MGNIMFLQGFHAGMCVPLTDCILGGNRLTTVVWMVLGHY